MERIRKILVLVISVVLLALFAQSGLLPAADPNVSPDPVISDPQPEEQLDEHGTYDSRDDVALFIYTYHRLPDNFMTKKEARSLGWQSGPLHLVVDGMCLGGDVYKDYEDRLPDISGTYYECDIDTLTRKKRGGKRIIYSDEWDIYYTDDHYKTFVKLYGD